MENLRKYKSGLVLGKMYPFHLGHKFLIQSALDNSDFVNVIVCYNPTQFISGESRAKAIQQEFELNKRIKVHLLEDSHLPQSDKDSNSLDEFYSQWVPEVREIVDDLDVVFTSEDYGEDFARYLGIDHYLVDKDRITFPISGTSIRNNPYDNWNFITNGMKPQFIKKVAIVGPESTGKSTLTQRLANYFQTNFVPEYGRLVSENKPDLEIDDFLHISEERQRLEDWMILNSNKLIITDTEDIVTYVFSKMYCPDQWTKYKEYFEESISKSHYDLYILMNPDCEPIQDGTRRYLDSRLEHYDQLKSHLIKFGKNWVEVGGSWENRYTESKKAISDLNI